MKNIVVIGDSILAGVIYDKNNDKYGYIGDKLANSIADKYKINIINKSVFGLTTTKVLQRYMHTRFCKIDDYTNCDILLIGLGSNDCDYDWPKIGTSPYAEHLPKTPLNTFKKNLSIIINDLKTRNILPILSTLTPIIATKYFDWVTRDCNGQDVLIWLKNLEHIYMWQELYSDTIREVAYQSNIPLLDSRKTFLFNNLHDYMCDDGIHLNLNGHKLLTQSIMDFIENNKHLL